MMVYLYLSKLQRGMLPNTKSSSFMVLDLPHKVSANKRILHESNSITTITGFATQSLYQPKDSAWVKRSHHNHLAPSVTLMPCPLKISKHEGGGLLVTPSHQYGTAPHQEWSSEGHHLRGHHTFTRRSQRPRALQMANIQGQRSQINQSSQAKRPKPHKDALYIVSILALNSWMWSWMTI